MLVSVIATALLLVTSALAAPSPQPAYKQTTRQAVTERLTNRAKGIARRQAPSPTPRVYDLCSTSGPADQGVSFARYDSVSPAGLTFYAHIPNETSLDGCSRQCAQDGRCQATDFDGFYCNLYSSYTGLYAGGPSFSLARTDCASQAAKYPNIAAEACCNYWV